MESKSDPPKRHKIHHQAEESASSSTPNQQSDALFMPNFPNELTVEILSRLPAKCLGKFKCVSISWLSLISSQRFVKTHLALASARDDFSQHNLILTVLPPNRPSHLKQCSVNSVLFSPTATNQIIEIDYPMKHPDYSFWVVGTCNGLVCIAVEETDLFLWNPCLKRSKKLPDMGVKLKDGCYLIFGFGYDKLSDDYKVVGIFCFFSGGVEYETEVKIYSLKTDCWMRIEDFKGGVPLDDSGKYANGKLHWAVSRNFDSWKIVCLDLANETYGGIERPSYEEGVYNWTFGVLGGCLSVLCNYDRRRADVWVMKEYGISDSWTKIVSVPYLDDPGKPMYSAPVCLLRNGSILLVFGSELVLYNPKRKSFTRYPQINQLVEVSTYVESLISPDTHDGEQRQFQ